ncbi:MAG TPA: murein biosynthesis integral membrane protein MurJ [Candidatus Polarisedimenticolia bacterium]|nr:murein biosynthesis integral membrane protein MurJ [Candidatus Polarisedimenticolia bacterium]
MLDGDRKLVRAAGSMSLMTALSRLAGYARDALQAALLGASNSTDAFVIAYRIPNLLRRLVAEGALTSAFVPTFARYMKRQDDAAMWRFAASVWWVLTAALVAIVVVGVLASPLLVHGLAWGYGDESGKMALTIALNRLMWPYIFFISLAALAAAILNALGFFALPAFTPVLLNLAIIACALGFRNRFSDPSYAFAIGVLVGGFLQLAVQIPALIKHGFRWGLPHPPDRDGVREVGRLMGPRVFGVGITQINLVIDSQFATSLRAGSASFLYYANRLTELTLGIFGISLSTVLLSTLSRAAAEGDRPRVLETLRTALRLLIFVSLPATVGLIVLRAPIVHVLFERNKFTPEDTILTSTALAAYSVGLLPYAAINVLASAFYAHRDTRTPVKVGVLTFFLHLGLNVVLRAPLQHVGIALSTSISAFVDAWLLAILLRRKLGDFLDRTVRLAAARALGASLLMGGALLLVQPFADPMAGGPIGVKLARLLALILGGGGVFVAGSLLFGSAELQLLRRVVTRRTAAP